MGVSNPVNSFIYDGIKATRAQGLPKCIINSVNKELKQIKMKVFVIALLMSLVAAVNCQIAELLPCVEDSLSDPSNQVIVSRLLADCTDLMVRNYYYNVLSNSLRSQQVLNFKSCAATGELASQPSNYFLRYVIST